MASLPTHRSASAGDLTAQGPSSHASLAAVLKGLEHEYRNALQQLSACAEMLAVEVQSSPTAADLTHGIQEAGTRLQHLLDDFCQYLGPLPSARDEVDLAAAWRAAWQSLKDEYPAARFSLVEYLQTEEVRAIGSPAAWLQVFRRIFDNTRDVCSELLRVEINCQPTTLGTRPSMEITVRDRGPGFSPAALPRAFEAFYSTRPQRAGLGLSIVRRIVEDLGGETHVSNSAEGGAVVRLIVPRESLAPSNNRG